MRTLCFHNRKGGCGKTTLTGNVGHAVSAGIRTVLVDVDPQGSLTSWLVTGDYHHELSDVLADGHGPGDALVELSPTLAVLPTEGRNQDGLKAYAEVRLFREPVVFDRLNADLARLGFDLAIYDLGPGMSQLERCAIMAVDEVVIPVLAEYFSVDGIEAVVADIDAINRGFDKSVSYRRLVVGGINRSFRRHLEVLEGYAELDFDMYTVAQDAKVAEAQFQHLPAAVYAPRGRAVAQYQAIADAILREVR